MSRTNEREWAVSKQNWKFNWLTRWEEIWDPAFVTKWQTWMDLSPSAHVFFHPALVKAWVDTYLPLRDIRPYFLVAQSDETIVFLPLVLWRRNWKNAFQKLLIPVGFSDYDYHDPIVVNPKAEESFYFRSFWKAFERQMLLTKKHIAFDRLCLNGIRQAFSGSSDQWVSEEISPWVDLRKFNQSENFILSLKKSLRGDLRRQERRMTERGEVKHLVFSTGMLADALGELSPFLTAHSRRWPDAYKAPNLHKNIVSHGMKANLIHFSLLLIGNEKAAWHLGFQMRDRYYYYLPAHETKFDRFSPGKVLLLKCIEDVINKGVSVFDFLRGDESYKAGWTDKTEPLFSLQLDLKQISSKMKNSFVDKAKPAVQKLLS